MGLMLQVESSSVGVLLLEGFENNCQEQYGMHVSLFGGVLRKKKGAKKVRFNFLCTCSVAQGSSHMPQLVPCESGNTKFQKESGGFSHFAHHH